VPTPISPSSAETAGASLTNHPDKSHPKPARACHAAAPHVAAAPPLQAMAISSREWPSGERSATNTFTATRRPRQLARNTSPEAPSPGRGGNGGEEVWGAGQWVVHGVAPANNSTGPAYTTST
jgi:hypothetical protein